MTQRVPPRKIRLTIGDFKTSSVSQHQTRKHTTCYAQASCAWSSGSHNYRASGYKRIIKKMMSCLKDTTSFLLRFNIFRKRKALLLSFSSTAEVSWTIYSCLSDSNGLRQQLSSIADRLGSWFEWRSARTGHPHCHCLPLSSPFFQFVIRIVKHRALITLRSR